MAKPKPQPTVSSVDRKTAGNNARRTPDLTSFLAPAAGVSDLREGGPDADSELLRGLREIVWRMLPLDASVLVVSKGDEKLLALYGPRASHFPQRADGGYAGYYPPDGTAVIAQLEALRARGAQYLIFPKPSLWWLELYPKFTEHLHLRYPIVVHDPERYVIFALKRRAALDPNNWRSQLLDLVERCASETGKEPAVLDWNTGLELKKLLPNRAVFCPPTEESIPPYFDRSVDIVVLFSPDEEALRESRRVAGHAVVTLEPPDDSETAGASNDAADRLNIRIEQVNGDLRRTTPSSSIVIPTHNRWEQLGRCLASLEETLPDPFEGEIIVVDDASGDEMQAVLDEWERSATRLNLRIVRNSSNRGFWESCNLGAAAATGDIVVFLNDGTLPQFGWLGALLRIFRTDPTAGAVTGKLLYPDGRLREAGNVVYSDGSAASVGRGEYSPDDPLYSFVREVDYCSAALLATPRKIFDRLGGFDGPACYEDVDYCFALRERGHRVYYQPESVVVDVEGATGNTDLSGETTKYRTVNQAKFVEKWRRALRQQPEPSDPSRQADHRSANGAVGRALVCAPLLPEFDREGGSRRVYCLIEFLREAGWDVSFVAENPRGDERYVRVLQQQGVAVYRGFGPRTDELFMRARFDVAIFAFWHLAEDHMNRLRQISPNTKIMIDVIDLHMLRNARKYFMQSASDASSEFVQESGARNVGDSNTDFTSEMVRELKAYLQADAVLTPSDKEAEMISDLLGNWSLAHTVRDHEESIVSAVPFQDRQGILFVANFNHPPNLDAVIFFCEEILPRIDQGLLHEHPVSIVGHQPPPAVLRYAKFSPFVRVFGWVPSVVPYLQSARVTVVPMRYGAGTKRKLLQALMAHTPTVTTTIGIEGLSVVPGRHVLLADDAASFAAATERLLSDPELWASLRDKGGERVTKLHHRDAVRNQLLEVLESKVARAAGPG